MSRYYEMNVEIAKYRSEQADAIREAAEQEWPFDDWFTHSDTMQASAADHLCAGETEEQFADRLAKAIWEANGAYCDVTVKATYLDSLPYEEHRLGEDDYARLMRNRPDPAG
jgi:hypothetical protein